MKSTVPRILIIVGSLLLTLSASSLAVDQPKTTSMKGKVFRSDTNQPIANAVIVLLDEKKSDKQDNSIDTKTWLLNYHGRLLRVRLPGYVDVRVSVGRFICVSIDHQAEAKRAD